MTDKQAANVGQLRLVDGTRVENPANLGVAERRSILPVSGRGKGRLYVLVELTGGSFGREEMAQDLVAAIVEEYFHTSGTVTYGLRQAVLMANAYLRRSNDQITSEHRLGGVACVAMRGREAFIAQAGGPIVYLVHGEQVQAFPDMTLEDPDAAVLGQNQTIEVHLFRTPVQQDDTVLMLDSPLARNLTLTRIAQIVSSDPERTVSNLQTLAPDQACTAMAIRPDPGASQAREPADQWTFTPVEPATEADKTTPLASPAPALPQEQITQDTPFVQEYDEPSETSPPAPQRTGTRASDPIGAVVQTVGAGIRSLGESLLPDKRPHTMGRRGSPSQAADARGGRDQHRRRAVRTRRGRGQEARQPNWGLAVALAIPILVLIFVGGYTAYRNWSSQSQYNASMEEAKLKRDLALGSAESPAVARDHWLEVLASLKAAETLQPEEPEIAQMRAQAEAELDRIDGVTRLGQIYRIYEYNLPGSTPSRVVVAGLDVYVLDRGMGRVYHHALNEVRNALRNPNADQVLLQRGQSVEDKTIGDLVDIGWMQDGGEGQAGALAVLDRDGLLVEYDPTWEQLSHQVVGGQDQWRAPLSLRTFDSNLYLLDPTANQIFKYLAEQFATDPDRWIKQSDTDLSKAVDMSIDGNIYVLHNNGQILKYYGGETAPFTVTQVPRALGSAVALYTDVEEVTQYMYVADASERRIVQLDREGTFVRQLQPALGQEESFRQLSGMFVDEAGAKLYFIATNTLFVTDIPPVQSVQR
jgi:hypothetical protein